jgi:hypothetical protein
MYIRVKPLLGLRSRYDQNYEFWGDAGALTAWVTSGDLQRIQIYNGSTVERSKTWGGAKDERRGTKGEGRKAKDEIYIYQRRGKRNPKTKEQKVIMHTVIVWIRKSTFQTISDIISIPGPSLKKSKVFSLDIGHHKVHLYLEYHSICTLVWIGTSLIRYCMRTKLRRVRLQFATACTGYAYNLLPHA